VLEFMLKNVRHSYSSIDSVTIITMKTIANQCPKTGGRAVLIARGILEIVESNYYNDDLLCGIPLLKPFVETVIEVTEKHEMSSIRIFPNPASKEVNLEILKNSDQTSYSVELLDWNGRVLRQQHELYPGLYTFSVEHLPNGLYFVRVHNGKQEANMYKLMIMK
jgi:hypothetical protein